ncbi:MAG: hypothetical protein D6731_05445 [Planctomycetota bacterium]|nr:MAG: hypothetical protein D6731_05445 [Planctomycetota bacterium]
MRCRCPVCNQTADYPERYAGKWHKCVAGCAPYPGTRLVIVPGGFGIPEVEVASAWRGAVLRGRLLRLAAGLFLLALAVAPLFCGAFPTAREVLVLWGGVGSALSCAALHAALRHTPRPPPGL